VRYREAQIDNWVSPKSLTHFLWGKIIGLDESSRTIQIQAFDAEGRFLGDECLHASDVNAASPSYAFQDCARRSAARGMPAVQEQVAGEKMIPVSKVVEVARKYARKHNMCDVVDTALAEMGIAVPMWRFTVELPRALITSDADLSIANFRQRNKYNQLTHLRRALASLAELNNPTISVEEIPAAGGPPVGRS
jgi:hypothetical protein